MHVARVIVDIPAREIERAFDYLVPEGMDGVVVGSCVLVDFANRPAVGYVTSVSDSSEFAQLKEVSALLGGPYFSEEGARTAAWIAREYLCPLSEAIKLFTPPGGTPKAVRKVEADGSSTWELRRAGVGAVDDRWVGLTEAAEAFAPSKKATAQRAVLAALTAGPVRVAELAADLGSVDGAIRRLEELGVVAVEHRRRQRSVAMGSKSAPRHTKLSAGQIESLDVIGRKLAGGGGVVVCDGVTGSGKTEVYLRAIEQVLADGGSACVLVPEISLTPQTVGRFRSRFGDTVAVLHSRLSAGERFDQWDRVASGEARVVVGARSALFAPLHDLRLVVIDEEHESSYKQSSAPRYHARDVASHLVGESGATLVLGSASPSLETLARCESGEWTRVELPERVTGRPLPPVEVVDMAEEFTSGHRSMFSRRLTEELVATVARGEKAVLFLNRRGFASFLLCRECGHVPGCESCSTSLTYHETGQKLVCHHCGSTRPVPPTCPECGSPYLRQFGAGTQRVEAELAAVIPGVPIVRMDADTTKGKGAHERLLLEFEGHDVAVLLGTQMIAKGLDYPEVTLVGVINADTTLRMPDFRAGERTWQLLEQVAGRAGRGERPGRVIVQTYWADNPAIRAAAAHDFSIFHDSEVGERSELGYPPFGRLANVLVWSKDNGAAARDCTLVAEAIKRVAGAGWQVLGPSPSALSRLKGVYRWHVLVKAPLDADLPGVLAEAMATLKRNPEVSRAVDIDALDLL